MKRGRGGEGKGRGRCAVCVGKRGAGGKRSSSWLKFSKSNFLEDIALHISPRLFLKLRQAVNDDF